MSEWAAPDTPSPAPVPIQVWAGTGAPPPYVPPPPVPQRRRHTGPLVSLLVLAALVAIGLGSAGGWYLAHRPTDTSEVAGKTLAAPTTAASALPPDQDPSTPQYRMLRLIRQIDRPAGFDELAPNWSGKDLRSHFLADCADQSCWPDVIRATRLWAPNAGIRAAAVPDGCLPVGCMTSGSRDGFPIDVRLGTVQEDVGTTITVVVLDVIIEGP